MSELTLSNVFVDGNEPSVHPVGSELQENFDDIKTILNGNLDGSNVSSDAEIECAGIETTDLSYAEDLLFDEIDESVFVQLEDITGSRLVIKNSNDETIFEIDENNKIIIGAE